MGSSAPSERELPLPLAIASLEIVPQSHLLTRSKMFAALAPLATTAAD
jgi:hypothetical protein